MKTEEEEEKKKGNKTFESDAISNSIYACLLVSIGVTMAARRGERSLKKKRKKG